MHGQSIISIGPHVAFGARMLTGNDDGEIGLGGKIGVTTSIKINDHINASPGLYFTRKGYYYYTIEIVDLGGIEENQQLSYLDLYLPVDYKISQRFFLKAGLQTGFLLSANFIDNFFNFDESFPGDNSTNIKPYMHKLDYGILTGFGYQSKKKFGVELVGNWGLRDIIKSGNHKEYFEFNHYNGKNLMITAGIYYLFEIKKRNKIIQ